jgi:hypothetical protein
MGANTEILEELRVVENEIKSFIFGEIPKAQHHVLNLLQAAALQLRCAQAKEGPTTDIDQSVIVFLESSDRTVVSSLKLSECHVSELDVNIRFPKYNKGAGQHFSIVPRSSYLLRQVGSPRLCIRGSRIRKGTNASSDCAAAKKPGTQTG